MCSSPSNGRTTTGAFVARLILCLTVAGCGVVGPSDSPEHSSISGSAVVGDEGGFSVDVEGNFRKEGMLHAELSWTVVAPGSGRFGAQTPRLGLLLDRDCSMCPVVSEDGPANQCPLSLSGPVETSWRYLVRIVNSRLCGGCRIEYRLEVTHPEGSVRLRPPRTCPRYVVHLPQCVQCPGVTNPVVDLQASPPRARMRVGDRALIDVNEAGCFTTTYQVESLSVADPAVAEIQNDVWGDPSYLAALRPGQTGISATVLQVDGSRVQADLGHCATTFDSCAPTRLVLEVVR